MKRKLILALMFMLTPLYSLAQSSGTTPPPPPVCSASIAGTLYTNTSTTPPTVYTCSYFNLQYQWVVNPSYGGLVYYPTVPSTCSGALPVFLGGYPDTVMYLCESGKPYVIGSGAVSLQHNGANLTDQTLLNFDDTQPTAPVGAANVKFQSDIGGDLSAYLPEMGVDLLNVNAVVPDGCTNNADPTGVEDSTCALKFALTEIENEAPTLGGALPTLYIPAGTYKLSGDPRFSCYVNVTGAGPNATILDETNDAEGVSVVGTGTAQVNDWDCSGTLSDIGFDAPNTPQYTATQLQLLNAVGYTLRDIRVEGGAGRGIEFLGSTERVKAYHLEIDTVRWPFIMTGNENHVWGLNIASPGELSTGYCYGANCVNGVYPNTQWDGGTLVSASANGSVATFYVHGTYADSTPGSNAPISVGNVFNVSGTTGTVLDGTYTATSVTNDVTSDPSGSCTSTAPCFEVQGASTANGTAVVTSAKWLPGIVRDQHSAVVINGANTLIEGGSIKSLWYEGGVDVGSYYGSKIGSVYFEGYPVNGQPHLDSDVTFGGYVVHTTLAQALPASTSSVLTSVASNAWFAAYLNDLSDAESYGNDPTYTIAPEDYLAGSTAPSAYVPGVERGQYENVTAIATTNNGLYISQRDARWSTAPSGTAWPAGSLVFGGTGRNNYGTYEIANSHLNAIDGAGPNWYADCDDGGVNTCAEISLGDIPNGINATYDSSQDNYMPVISVNFQDDEWWTGPVLATSELMGQGWIKCTLANSCTVKVNDITPDQVGNEIDSGTIYFSNGYGGFHIVPDSAGSYRNADLYTPGGGVFSWSGTTNNFIAPLYGQPGSLTNTPWGLEFASQWCSVDTPPSGGTSSLNRFCVNGSPASASGGISFQTYQENQWLTLWDVGNEGPPVLGGAASTISDWTTGAKSKFALFNRNEAPVNASDTFNGPLVESGISYFWWNGSKEIDGVCGWYFSSNTAPNVVPTGMNDVYTCGQWNPTSDALPMLRSYVLPTGSDDNMTGWSTVELPAATSIGGVPNVADVALSIPAGTQAADSCSTPATLTMTGVTTATGVGVHYAAQPTGAGWSAPDVMQVQAWPSAANTVSYQICNNSTASESYGAITMTVSAR